MRGLDPTQFRKAARASVTPPGGTARPTRADQLARELASAILGEQIARRTQASFVSAIIDALCSDILAARRHSAAASE